MFWPLLTIILVLLAAGPAVAQDTGYTPPAPPVDLDLGFDTRVRQVTIHNLLDFDSEEDSGFPGDAVFFRVRHRLSADLHFRQGFSLQSRFTTAWRKYLAPWETP